MAKRYKLTDSTGETVGGIQSIWLATDFTDDELDAITSLNVGETWYGYDEDGAGNLIVERIA